MISNDLVFLKASFTVYKGWFHKNSLLLLSYGIVTDLEIACLN